MAHGSVSKGEIANSVMAALGGDPADLQSILPLRRR